MQSHSLHPAALGVLVFAALQLAGCATFYVDQASRRLGPSDMVAPKEARPVQLLYEFQTRGVVNAGATATTRGDVQAVVVDSKLFSRVEATPAGGRRLVLTINNIPVTSESDAYAKGFVTGLTFGLVGTLATDGYLCTGVLYDGDVEQVSAKVQDAIHTRIGAGAAPAGLTAMPARDAIREVAERLTWNVLREISRGANK